MDELMAVRRAAGQEATSVRRLRSGPAADDKYDVVVAGFGYSGAMAAIAAADEGASVLLLEKNRYPGGNSVLSGGGCAFGRDFDKTLAYLRATCGGNTDDELLVTFARGMVEIPSQLGSLADAVGMDVHEEAVSDAVYPFPGADALGDARITRNERYPGIDWVRGGKAGATLFWVLLENVGLRSNITVVCDAPMTDLLVDAGEVVGCEAVVAGAPRRLAARRAVVLCTGGFEHNHRLIRHFVGSEPSAPAVGSPGNTGDGILLAQKAGAALWHMWHLHGSYGMTIPEFPLGIRHSCGGARSRKKSMPWILVNRNAERFMNEYPPAPQDTPIRELLYYDANVQAYPNIPAFMIFDEIGRKRGPIGVLRSNDPGVWYEWSPDNQKEIGKGYIKRAGSLAELAGIMDVSDAALAETIATWNASVKAGQDASYGRPAWSMEELATPPFYGVEVRPIITNTQGGLVHDARQRVVNPFGEPIPRLYKAGEMGSIFGHLYLLGGNNAECLIGGRIAGMNAAQERSW